jgi:hypothetical protein
MTAMNKPLKELLRNMRPLVKETIGPSGRAVGPWTTIDWFEALTHEMSNHRRHPMFTPLLYEFLYCYLQRLNGDADNGGTLAVSMDFDSVSDLEFIVNFRCDHGRVGPLYATFTPSQSSLFLRIRVTRDPMEMSEEAVSETDIDHIGAQYVRRFRVDERKDETSHLRDTIPHFLRYFRQSVFKQHQFRRGEMTGDIRCSRLRFWVVHPACSWEITFNYLPVVREHRKFLALIRHLGKAN